VQILIIHTGVWITKEILPHTAKTRDGCGFQRIRRVNFLRFKNVKESERELNLASKTDNWTQIGPFLPIKTSFCPQNRVKSCRFSLKKGCKIEFTALSRINFL
jgi:hypothetical protein